jgi:hypothetical protein
MPTSHEQMMASCDGDPPMEETPALSNTRRLWPAVALYIRLFVIAGTGFGLAMALFIVPVILIVVPSWSSLSFGPLMALEAGVAFGALMALTLGSVHLLVVAPYGISRDLLRARQTRQIDLPMPYDEAFRLCLNLLVTDIRAHIRHEDRESGNIQAVTSVSWRSWGMRITVTLRELGAVTHIEVEARHLMRTTMVDYGASLDMAQRMVDLLRYSTVRHEPVA